MTSPRSCLLPWALVGLGLVPSLWSQDAGLQDPAIPVSELKTKLAALEKHEDVDAVRAAWKKLVVAKEAELLRTEEQAKKSSGEEKRQLDEATTRLLEERADLVERLRAVLGVYEERGGSQETLDADKKYVDNLPTHIRLTDPGALWTWLKNWITSPKGGIKWGLNIVLFFVILFGFRLLSSFSGKIVGRTLSASKLEISGLLRDFFINSVRKIVFFIGVVIALSQIGIDIAPFLAGMGVLGLVVGFALQGTLSNFASGIMILMYRPYDIGHFIEAAGVKGSVTAMSLVSTTLTSPDNQIVVIPNGSIWGGVITNVTGNKTRRVDLLFGIGYEDDIAKAERVLHDIVSSHELVLKDPAPVIKLHELADSSVNFVVRPWTKTSDYWTVHWDITRAVKERFDAEGISIPFPQTDMHVHGLDKILPKSA